MLSDADIAAGVKEALEKLGPRKKLKTKVRAQPTDEVEFVKVVTPPKPPAATTEPPTEEPADTTVETTVTLTATEDGTLDDAAAVAALAEELGVEGVAPFRLVEDAPRELPGPHGGDVRVVRGAALDRAGRPERVLAGDAAEALRCRGSRRGAQLGSRTRQPLGEVAHLCRGLESHLVEERRDGHPLLDRLGRHGRGLLEQLLAHVDDRAPVLAQVRGGDGERPEEALFVTRARLFLVIAPICRLSTIY